VALCDHCDKLTKPNLIAVAAFEFIFKIELDSKPSELDEMDRKIMQLKIESVALKNEDDQASKDRLTKVNSELLNLEKKSSDFKNKKRKRNTQHKQCKITFRL
jgi:ATP-dependent Clp protease ATP-binding subunit ClpA